MGIGTSKGAFYEDQFHYAQSQWDPGKFDDNEITPNKQQTDKSLENAELNPSTGLGIEVGKKEMPFPDNNNPDLAFNNRFGNLPPSGIINDLKKPTGETVPLMRKIDYKTASPLVTITDEDIDKATGLALSFSGGGLSTSEIGGVKILQGKDSNVTPMRPKAGNDNVPDTPMYGATKIDQLARKLAETENGKGSWDRIGGGGQEHYYRDARKALRNVEDAGQIPTPEMDKIIDKSWKDLAAKSERDTKLIDDMAKLRDRFVDRDWSDFEYAKYNKLGKELHGKHWEDMTREILNKPLE